MSDVFCAAVLNGDLATAERYTAERGWKFVIALIKDDKPAAEQIEQDIGDCPHCLRAFARHLGGLASGLMIGRPGKENALRAAQISLNEAQRG